MKKGPKIFMRIVQIEGALSLNLLNVEGITVIPIIWLRNFLIFLITKNVLHSIMSSGHLGKLPNLISDFPWSISFTEALLVTSKIWKESRCPHHWTVTEQILLLYKMIGMKNL